LDSRRPCEIPAQASGLPFSGFVPAAKRFVYVLKDVEKEPHFYVGLTSDVEARLADHNMGRCPHTASHRPWHLHVVIEFPDAERAIRFEHYLKSGSGRAFAKRHFEP
jgi:predicted GIY-YIG superfamily endonuclease